MITNFYFGISCCKNPGNGCCSFVFEKICDGVPEISHYSYCMQDTTSSRILLEGILKALDLVASLSNVDEIYLYTNQKYLVDYFQNGMFTSSEFNSFTKCSNSDLLSGLRHIIQVMHCPVSACLALPGNNNEMRIAKELAQQYCTESGYVF